MQLSEYESIGNQGSHVEAVRSTCTQAVAWSCTPGAPWVRVGTTARVQAVKLGGPRVEDVAQAQRFAVLCTYVLACLSSLMDQELRSQLGNQGGEEVEAEEVEYVLQVGCGGVAHASGCLMRNACRM